MKHILIIFLALVLVACSAPPAATTEAPAALPEATQTPAVVVITATSAPTEVSSPTPLPTYTALPTYTMPPAPTEAPAQPQQPAPTEAVAAPTQAPPDANSGVISVDDTLGAGWFVNMTRSRNDFSLRCQLNKEITFTVKSTSPDATSVDLWYRIEDRGTGAIFDWVNFGRMVSDNTGNFTITLSGDKISPNFRKPNSWFDYQFVAYNPTGVIGRSEKIEKQVSYTFDCP
jgi:hypothetical protein